MTPESMSHSTVRFPPFAVPGAVRPVLRRNEVEALPSIDDFIDDLPSILDFTIVEGAEELQETVMPVSVDAPAATPSEEGWAENSWQSFDWKSAASLTERHTERDTATQSWGSTSWDQEDESEPLGDYSSTEQGSAEQSPGRSAADEVASALDGIARRIRSGELVIDDLEGRPPEAAMAAALAILLRMRG